VVAPAMVAAQATGSAVFTGTVVDSARHPLPNAEISLPGLSITRMTDDSGKFRIPGIPAGTHKVNVRRIAFGQLDTSITFADDHTVQLRITLGSVVRLDSVVVTDRSASRDVLMQAFEENRRKGFGRFVLRDQLEKQSGVTLGSIVASMQGVAERSRQWRTALGSVETLAAESLQAGQAGKTPKNRGAGTANSPIDCLPV
jgi:hypothetical protein